MAIDQDFLLKIVRSFNEESNESLREEISAFRQSSAEYEQFYNEVRRVWIASYELQNLPKIDVHEATARLSEKLKNTTRYRELGDESPSASRWYLKIAAVLLAGVLAYWSYTYFYQVQYLTLETTENIDSVFLSDGTKIFVDRNTTLTYPKQIKGNERKVTLSKGNAFFDVARNKKIPFVVQLDQSLIKVLGTEFNIALSSEKVELSVNEGAVLFQPELVDTYSILTAGKGLIYHERTGLIDSIDVTNRNADAWLTGKLKFTDASLAEVLQSLQDFYKVNIKLEDSIANFKQFNATFEKNELQEALEVLQATYPIRIERQDTVLVIKSN